MITTAEWINHRDGTFSFMSGVVGWCHAVFGLCIDGTAHRSDTDYRIENNELISGKTRETMTIIDASDASVVIRRDITNRTDKPIAVSEIRDFYVPEPLALGGAVDESYIYHCEGIFEWDRYRVFFKELLHRPEKTTLGDPLSPHFGATGWSPYTGIVFANTESNAALIEGVLSQNRFYRYWTPQADGRVCATMGMFGIDAKIIEPGETLQGELIYLEINTSFDPLSPFDAYNSFLDKYIPVHAKLIDHRHDLIWGTWNDGPYNMVHDFMVRENTDWIKKNLPNVTWIQIDEGYQVLSDCQIAIRANDMDTGAGRPRVAHYHFMEEENEGISKRKFPEGMKAVSDYIRLMGLRPAIWTGLHATRHSAAVKNHKEWFKSVFEERGELTPLVPDPSIDECMDALKEGFRILIKEWGYEGIKLDFWTYGLIANQRPYAHPFTFSCGNKTGLEYMHELLGYVRRLLGDGYLQTGCDISCGNPFVGQYVDNFRFGIDVGDGVWRNAILVAKWMAFHALAAHRLGFLANADSIGVLKGLTPAQRGTWNNFCFVSGSMLEICGDFTGSTGKIDSEYLRQGRPDLLNASFGCETDILERLQKLTMNVQNGTKILFPDASYLETNEAPAVWVKCDDESQAAFIGIFNWFEEHREIAMPRSFINSMGRLHDFFTGSEWALDSSGSVRLGACESLLLRVDCKTKNKKSCDQSGRVI